MIAGRLSPSMQYYVSAIYEIMILYPIADFPLFIILLTGQTIVPIMVKKLRRKS